MPRPADNGFPARDAVIDYLTQYEQRYALPVRRPVRVVEVHRSGEGFAVHTSAGTWQNQAVVCATGSWSPPLRTSLSRPTELWRRVAALGPLPGSRALCRQRVLVVGGGNSRRSCWRKSRG